MSESGSVSFPLYGTAYPCSVAVPSPVRHGFSWYERAWMLMQQWCRGYFWFQFSDQESLTQAHFHKNPNGWYGGVVANTATVRRTAVVHRTAVVGGGALVEAGAVLGPMVYIGERAMVCAGVTVKRGVYLDTHSAVTQATEECQFVPEGCAW